MLADGDLVGGRRRDFDVDDFQDFGPAMLFDTDCLDEIAGHAGLLCVLNSQTAMRRHAAVNPSPGVIRPPPPGCAPPSPRTPPPAPGPSPPAARRSRARPP